MVAFRREQGFHIPQSIRECMTRDAKTYLGLQPPATLACRGRIFVLAAPGNTSLPGTRCWPALLLFFALKRSGQDMQNPANQRKRRNRKKDADSTSKLGVSSC